MDKWFIPDTVKSLYNARFGVYKKVNHIKKGQFYKGIIGEWSFHGRIQRGGQGVRTPLKNHQNIGFLSNTGPDPLKNHKTTKSALNVGPSSARQQNAISVAFCWQADNGLLMVVLGSSLPLSTKKKNLSKLDYLWLNFLDQHMYFMVIFLWFLIKKFWTMLYLYGPPCEKTCLRGFRQSEFQTSLLSYRR